MVLLSLWGFYDFSVSLQNFFVAQLFFLFTHPPSILHQWNSLCFWLHLSGVILFPFATSFGLHSSYFLWAKDLKNVCSATLCSAYVTMEVRARKSLCKVPTISVDRFHPQVLQGSQFEKWALYCNQARGESRYIKWPGWMKVALSSDLRQAITTFQSQICFTPVSCCKMFCLAFAAFSRICLICLISASGFMCISPSLEYLFSPPSWISLM